MLNAIFIVLFKLIVFNFTHWSPKYIWLPEFATLLIPYTFANYIFLASNLEQNVNVPKQFVKTDPFIINNMRRLTHNEHFASSFTGVWL